MPKITAKVLDKALRKANQKAIQTDSALGLPILEVHDGYLVRIDPNSNQTRLRKAVFGLTKRKDSTIKFNKLKS